MSWQFDIASGTRARADQMVGGDIMFFDVQDNDILMVCIDVLGHGPKAFKEALKALHYLKTNAAPGKVFQPGEVLLALNLCLSGGRGAAVAACHIDTKNGLMTFAGVGNISVRRLFPISDSFHSRDGVVGANMRQPKEQVLTLGAGEIYLLHTDGIKSRFSHADYRQMVSDNAATGVAHILQHFSKPHDDAGCILFKVKK